MTFRIFALLPAIALAVCTGDSGVFAQVAAAARVAQTITFDAGEPSTVHWEASTSTLYIADNENNQVWSWTERGGLQKAWMLPDPDGAAKANASLVGQIVKLADGTFVVMRFGQPGGGFGGVAYVNPQTGRSGVVPNLDPMRKRLGMAVAQDGRIFGSYFVGMGGGKQTGAITLIDLQKGETEFAGGFQKITGLLVLGDSLIVADQLADTIYELPLKGPVPAPGSYKVLARLPRPDQMAPGPDGSIFTGQFQGAPGSRTALAVRQVMRDGTVRQFAEDPDVTRPSGLAWDAANQRLFVANGGNPAQTFVRVFAMQ